MKLLIMGNSASGKSTLALRLSRSLGVKHLDLDTLAWQADTSEPTRLALDESARAIEACVEGAEHWVVEGCYTDLLSLLGARASHLVFLDLPVETCLRNATQRPWEPHKYASAREQDENLPMLIRWIEQYDERVDVFSRREHRALFDRFTGVKTRLQSNVNEDEPLF